MKKKKKLSSGKHMEQLELSHTINVTWHNNFRKLAVLIKAGHIYINTHDPVIFLLDISPKETCTYIIQEICTRKLIIALYRNHPNVHH